MKNKELRSWLVALAFQLVWVPLFFMEPSEEYNQPEEVIEEEWDLIRWKQEDAYEESLDVSVEPLELEVAEESERGEVFAHEK